MQLRMLTVEEVKRIHEILVEEFASSGDPISPPGVKSENLLGSAVFRQETGARGVLKYGDPISNAATLLLGLCMDHPFHNGNKRTALVSMLVHLDKNKLVLDGTRQNDLYDLVMAVATHTITPKKGLEKKRGKKPFRRSADEEVKAISDWISKRAKRVRRGEKQITYRQLRSILEGFGYSLQNPKKNTIDVIKSVPVTRGLLRRKKETVQKRIGGIPYPGDGAFVAIRDLKRVRQLCRLTEEDGYDTDAFYSDSAVIDAFVNRYRTILRRLASK